MDENIKVFGNEYTKEAATRKMRGHISWLFWIAGLTFANVIYILLDQGYFMVAGLGLDAFLAAFLADTEEQFRSFRIYLGVGFVAFFIMAGYLGLSRNIGIVTLATFVYAVDTLLVATVYFDIMSLVFHIWATVSLVMGVMIMNQLNKPRQEPASSDLEA